MKATELDTHSAALPQADGAPQATNGKQAVQQRIETMRQQQNNYEGLAKRMNTLLGMVQSDNRVDADAAKLLREEIIQYHRNVGNALFDVLQLVRFGANYPAYHALNVALLNLTIAKTMHMGTDTHPRLVDAGMLMDVGMFLLPGNVLEGRTKLDDMQQKQLHNHPQFAVSLLEKCGYADKAALLGIIAAHHERFNGTGYPKRLSGQDIPLEARVTAVADSFDAATARRQYRGSKSPFAILQELADNKDGALDSNITQAAAVALAQMLVNRFVVLSDHSVGKVVEFFPDSIAYPLVVVVGKRIQTDATVYPVALSSQMRLF